jgi:hypothetical protein
MKLVKNFSTVGSMHFLLMLILVIAIAAVPALSQTVVTSPTNNETVSSPFNLTMHASTCSSIAVNYVGYSLDNGSTTAIYTGQSMDGPVSAPSGTHTLHIKVWNDSGGICLTDVTVNVGGAGSGGGGATSVIPADAVKLSSIQTLSDWTEIHDGGTPGSSSGATSLQSSPSLTGSARLFQNQFNDYGGERYSAQFDDNTTSEGFFYDAWVYIADNANGFANLEFDVDQTMENGETVVMGFQCDSWNGTWDYAVNAGSPTAYNDTWGHSKAPCNVHNWGANQWHHVQIYFVRNTSGWVNYNTVWLDGVQQYLNITAFSGYSLGWGPTILTQFQIDGNSPNTSWGNVYLDEITVYRW